MYFSLCSKSPRTKKLLLGKTVGFDSTTLEADAAMSSIVRRHTGEDWKQYVARLMGLVHEGETPTDEEIRSASDVTQQTFVDSVLKAEKNIRAIGAEQSIEEVAGHRGYHSLETIELASSMKMRTYIPVPRRTTNWSWNYRTADDRRAVILNQQRIRRDKGKQLSVCGASVANGHLPKPERPVVCGRHGSKVLSMPSSVTRLRQRLIILAACCGTFTESVNHEECHPRVFHVLLKNQLL